MAIESLIQLGLTSNQANIYTAVLSQGKISAVQIAKITRINRTTVYSVIKELLSKRLLVEDLASETTLLIATPPQQIVNIIAQEEQALLRKRQLAEQLVPELQSLTKGAEFFTPKLVYVAEEHIEKYLYEHTPKWNATLDKYGNTAWGFQDQTFTKEFETWVKWVEEYNVKSGKYLVNLLTNDTAVEQELTQSLSNKRNVKFWKNNSQFTASIWAVGDYLIFVRTNQKPFYLIEMHDPVFSGNMRELLKGIWETI